MSSDSNRAAAIPLVIIGGGIHGTIFSLALATRFPRDYHLVIDPHPTPLRMWEQNCRACGLQYLRSPAAHQLSSDPHSLLRFQREGDSTGNGASSAAGASGDNLSIGNETPPFIPRYKRPLLSLFMRHARSLIKRHDLMQFRAQATCKQILLQERHAVVETDCGSFTAERVLICIGMTGQPRIPQWAATSAAASASIAHVFGSSFNLADYRQRRRVVIVGGGITALQLALTIANTPLTDGDAATLTQKAGRRTEAKQREVIVLSRHQLRYADFDSDPCYLGPRCLADFDALDDPQQKAERITAARNHASIPPDIAKRFAAACVDGRCQLIAGEVAHAEREERTSPATPNGHAAAGEARCHESGAGMARHDSQAIARTLTAAASNGSGSPSVTRRQDDRNGGAYRLHLTDGQRLNCDAVILATGFEDDPLRAPLLRNLQQRYGLPCSAEGMPLTDQQLRWHPRLLLSGGAAAMTAGPAAGNIIGAQLALRRVLPLLQGRHYRREYAWRAVEKAING